MSRFLYYNKKGRGQADTAQPPDGGLPFLTVQEYRWKCAGLP